MLTQPQAQERLQREWKSTRHWAAGRREVIPAVLRQGDPALKPPPSLSWEETQGRARRKPQAHPLPSVSVIVAVGPAQETVKCLPSESAGMEETSSCPGASQHLVQPWPAFAHIHFHPAPSSHLACKRACTTLQQPRGSSQRAVGKKTHRAY